MSNLVDAVVATWPILLGIAVAAVAVCAVTDHIEERRRRMPRYQGTYLMVDKPDRLVIQRATDDVLIRIVYRDKRPTVVRYANQGQANYLLTRYSPENYLSKQLPAYVERADQ